MDLDPAVIGTFIPIVALIVGGAVLIFAPLARAHARNLDKQSPQIPATVSARLERIEQSLEAIALEVERISEGQRFTTKLLAERSPTQHGAVAAASSVNPSTCGISRSRSTRSGGQVRTRSHTMRESVAPRTSV
jgi:hypothetical protein